jgi:nitroimidazol reductase NimA-like FMN-containing flavoprotein (pyridoxamine 5'-phosphate oxidase superfamily)
MTAAECRNFLLDRARTAILATVRADGPPRVIPVWFDLGGESFMFTTGAPAVKVRNMREDAHLSLCVDEETPFHFVLVDRNPQEHRRLRSCGSALAMDYD